MRLRHDQLRTKDPKCCRAAVLVLHGGTDHAVRAKQPARRFFPATMNSHWIQDGIYRELETDGVAVWALRHRLAGWDDNSDPTPVAEARAAIREIAMRHGSEVPVVVIGISMGGRTAVRAADEPTVRGVIGLVPWLPKEESPDTLRGKHLRVGWAGLDRTATWQSMQAFIEQARGVAASVAVTKVGPDVHEMILPRTWQPFATRCVRDILDCG